MAEEAGRVIRFEAAVAVIVVARIVIAAVGKAERMAEFVGDGPPAIAAGGEVGEAVVGITLDRAVKTYKGGMAVNGISFAIQAGSRIIAASWLTAISSEGAYTGASMRP